MSESKRKGIKRHKSLYPLSHHHHHALVLALKLKRAGTEKSELTIQEIRDELQQFWNESGEQHFREEEEILLPIYAMYEPIDQEIIAEMLVEHVKVRSFVKQVAIVEGEPVDLMHELGELLDAHIRKEERIIFPMIEEALPEDELKRLEPYLH